MIYRPVLLALALAGAVAARGMRRASTVVPEDLVITSEAIARMQSDDQDTLYNVAMTYDRHYGGSDGGNTISWCEGRRGTLLARR